MFSHEGDTRSDRQNRQLAGYLALVGGYTNSSGFLVVGTFTSHVTGNVGRFANDTVSGQPAAATSAVSMIFAFFLGAFVVSVMLESRWFGHVSRAYASALALEALFLLSFVLLTQTVSTAHPRAQDGEAALLCLAMGMQNALVTRLSGAVVRTTHLTGVVTDLGIEAARWFRYWRRSVAEVTRVSLIMGPNQPERPASRKVLLLGTIALSFLVGSLGGAMTTLRFGSLSIVFAVIAVGLCSIYAIVNGIRHSAAEARASRQ